MTKEFLVKAKSKRGALALLKNQIDEYAHDRKFKWIIEPQTQIFKQEGYRAYARIEMLK